MNYQVIIIGGGPAGISSLLWCHSLGLQAILLEQSSELGGQMLQMYHPVLEYPGLPDQTGLELRDAFETHLRAYELNYRVNCHISEIKLSEHRLRINDESLTAAAIIIATGARNRRLGLLAEEKLIGNLISYSASRDQQKFAGQNVCVVGGGDSAFEDAWLMAEVCPRVTLIHRSANFRARPEWRQRVFDHPRISLLPNSEIVALNQTTNDLIELTVAERVARTRQQVIIGGLFVRLGIEPNTAFLQGQVELDEAGYIITDQAQKTSLPNVYGVGDVCRPVCLSIATAIGHGAIAAKSIANQLPNNA
jgi:thioredoxin reductase (NADPH)